MLSPHNHSGLSVISREFICSGFVCPKFLTDAAQIWDSVFFSAQQPKRSYDRCAEARGSFAQKNATRTPEAINDCSVVGR